MGIRYEFFIRFDLKLLQFQIIGLNNSKNFSQLVLNPYIIILALLDSQNSKKKFSQNNLLKTHKHKIPVKLHYIFTRTLSPNFSFLRNVTFVIQLHHPPHLSKSRHRWRQHRDRHWRHLLTSIVQTRDSRDRTCKSSFLSSRLARSTLINARHKKSATRESYLPPLGRASRRTINVWSVGISNY